jgi:hypothetical protein
MGEEDYDKREHSAKREVDDLTNYQKLNSLGGAGVAVNPDEVPKLNESGEDEAAAPITTTPVTGPSDEVAVYDGDFNDGADFSIVDDEGKTNI